MNHKYTCQIYFSYDDNIAEDIGLNVLSNSCALLGLDADNKVNKVFNLEPEFFDNHEYSIPTFDNFDGDTDDTTIKDGYDCYVSHGYNQGDAITVIYDKSVLNFDSESEMRKYINAVLWDSQLHVIIWDETQDVIFTWDDFIRGDWDEVREEIIDRALGDIVVNEDFESENEIRRFLERAIPEDTGEIPTEY